MRILMLSEFLPPVRGGLEGHVALIGRELAARGHDLAYATLTRRPDPQAGPVFSLRGTAHHLPHEDPDRPFTLPLPDPATAHDLSKIVSAFEPDVVHGHNWLAVSLHGLGKHRNLPLVLTLHDYSQICALRTLFDADGNHCSGPRARKCLMCTGIAMGRSRSLALVPATTAGRHAMRPDAVIAVSDAVRRAALPYLTAPVDVIHNFVDAQPAREPLPLDFPTGRYVMYAGDIGPHKGIDDLLGAWQRARRPGVTLVLATTRRLTREVLPGVHVTSLRAGQMVDAWRGADVAVVPSRWPEPCPLVVFEAQRAGVPVVATTVGGLPELVDDGVSGLLVPPRNPPALAQQVGRLLDEEDLRTRLSRGARAAAAASTAQEAIERLVEVYRRVAA